MRDRIRRVAGFPGWVLLRLFRSRFVLSRFYRLSSTTLGWSAYTSQCWDTRSEVRAGLVGRFTGPVRQTVGAARFFGARVGVVLSVAYLVCLGGGPFAPAWGISNAFPHGLPHSLGYAFAYSLGLAVVVALGVAFAKRMSHGMGAIRDLNAESFTVSYTDLGARGRTRPSRRGRDRVRAGHPAPGRSAHDLAGTPLNGW